jgi:hypothetical protein
MKGVLVDAPASKQFKEKPRLRLYDLATTQAGGANPQLLVAGAHLGFHWAQIDIPAPLGDVVGVADVISKLRPLAANVANL